MPMGEVFVVGYDDAKASDRAVAFAAEGAKASKGEVHLVYILEWSPYSFHTPEELAERHGRREDEIKRATALVAPAVDRLKKDGVTASCEVRHGNAGELLCQIATEKKARQIVIGRSGDSALSQRLLGGLAFTLAHAAPVPVTIVP